MEMVSCPLSLQIIMFKSFYLIIWSTLFTFSTKLDQKTLDDLQSRGHMHGLVVFSAHRDTVDILSSTHSLTSLQHLGLLDCIELANVQDLVMAELTENFHKLQHNVGEWVASSETMTEMLGQHAMRRSVHKRECTLTGQCDGEEDTWFTEYVRKLYCLFILLVK